MLAKHQVDWNYTIKEEETVMGEKVVFVWRVWEIYKHHVVFREEKSGIKRSYTNAQLWQMGAVDPLDKQHPFKRGGWI